jgi:hypothetical protein
LNFLVILWESIQISNFKKIHPVGEELVDADRLTEGHAEAQRAEKIFPCKFVIVKEVIS